METMMQEGPHLAEELQEEDRDKAKIQLPQLKQKWEALLLGANSRSALCAQSSLCLLNKLL